MRLDKKRHLLPAAGIVAGAFLIVLSNNRDSLAQRYAPGVITMTPAADVPVEKLKPLAPPFQNGHLGDQPHLGQGVTGGQEYLHYDHPNYRYGHYYRPAAFGRGRLERCAPSPFRPRGFGNLFNEANTCYRLDYNRFVLKNYASEYGPSYYRLQPDPRCIDCSKHEKYRAGCDECGIRKTKIWTLSGRKPVQ